MVLSHLIIKWCDLVQEPRHLQLLADLEDSNIFTVIASKKLHNAPTEYEFCIKVRLHHASHQLFG